MRTRKLAAVLGAIAAATALVSTVNTPAATASRAKTDCHQLGRCSDCYTSRWCFVHTTDFPGGRISIDADVIGPDGPAQFTLHVDGTQRCSGKLPGLGPATVLDM